MEILMTTELDSTVSVLAKPIAPHVALVTINRSAARNAVNGDVTRRLGSMVEVLEADPEVWAVVLTGAGDRAFCAGADLREISLEGTDQLVTREGGFAGFVKAARTKPWIAAVNGAAVAGGCEIALACDMIIASDDAQFGLPETKRGLAAVAGGLFRLTRSIPRVIAMELIATGRSISAADALRWGLVNAVVAKSEIIDRAVTLASEIAANAPIAVRESLAIARRAFDCDDQELFRMSNAAAVKVAATEDFKEGPLAFLEKRAPRWTGQ
jgi:enoyl-CoA hydratase/carnithine racemase